MSSIPARALVTRFDNLGDCILGEPLLAAMAAAWPGCRISVLARPETVELLTGHPSIHRLHAHDPAIDAARGPVASHLAYRAMIAATFRDAAPDLAIAPRPDWFDTLHPALAGYWSGAKERVACSSHVGFRRCATDQVIPGVLHRTMRRLAFTRIVATDDEFSCHEYEQTRRLAAGLSLTLPDRPDFTKTFPSALVASEPVALSADDTWVALAPGAKHPRRCWGTGRFAQVARELVRTGCRVVVLGSEQEDHTAFACDDKGITSRRGVALRTIPAILARCRLFIGNDSGLGHLAAAVGCPPLIISCHPIGAASRHYNSPNRFAPLHPQSQVLRPTAATRACSDGCVATHGACCIATIPVEDVLDHARGMMTS
jgi:ADP-heptose:LPS heptosyltransferase